MGHIFIVVSFYDKGDILNKLGNLMLGVCDFVTFGVIIWMLVRELQRIEQNQDFNTKRTNEPLLQPMNTRLTQLTAQDKIDNW